MVKEFGVPEQNIGYYVGFIASSFSFAQLLTSYFWGYLSDRFGRRPVLLIGLIGNTITMCLFGLSKSITWAICSRAACGLLNGNIGVAKSVLGEITNNQNRGAAFSLLGLNFGIGIIIGPSLGGLLSWPTKNFPAIFGGIEFLEYYPYFLPCFISSLISTCGFISGYCFLPETCQIATRTEEVVIEDDGESISECAPLISNRPLLDREETCVGVESGRFDETETNAISAQAQTAELTDKTKVGWQSICATLSYSILCFQDIIFVEVFPLWVASQPRIGFGWSSKDIGILLSMIGFFALFCQLIIYPWASKRVSPVSLFRTPIYLLMVVIITFPIISTYSIELGWVVWLLMISLMGIKTIIGNFLFTSIMVLVRLFLN
jgi:MFS family permease